MGDGLAGIGAVVGAIGEPRDGRIDGLEKFGHPAGEAGDGSGFGGGQVAERDDMPAGKKENMTGRRGMGIADGHGQFAGGQDVGRGRMAERTGRRMGFNVQYSISNNQYSMFK